jgi:hypothetical protein
MATQKKTAITKNTISSGNSGKIAAGQYLKKGGKTMSKKMYGGMKKGGTKKGM